MFYYLNVSEIMPDKIGGLWWECLYKRETTVQTFWWDILCEKGQQLLQNRSNHTAVKVRSTLLGSHKLLNTEIMMTRFAWMKNEHILSQILQQPNSWLSQSTEFFFCIVLKPVYINTCGSNVLLTINPQALRLDNITFSNGMVKLHGRYTQNSVLFMVRLGMFHCIIK